MNLKYYIKFWFPKIRREDVMEFTQLQMESSETDPREKHLKNLHFIPRENSKKQWIRPRDRAIAEIVTERNPIKCKKCGREPELIWLDMFNFGMLDVYYVRCNYCDVESDHKFTEDEAIDEWDKINL